ncbi:hypothetical protein C3489_33840 [Streptomyces sp. Ru71]|nr:hypothetical protein C3489_33840 [Streptomyces sp. Ru71]
MLRTRRHGRPGGGWRSSARRGASPKLFEQGEPPAPTRAALGAPPRPLRHWGRHDCPQRRRMEVTGHDGGIAARGGEGTGWGVSARSGRHRRQSVCRGQWAGPRTDTPHPVPDPRTGRRRYISQPPDSEGPPQAFQGRGELREQPRRHPQTCDDLSPG